MPEIKVESAQNISSAVSTPAEATAPTRTPLLSLKKRQEELKSELWIDLPVPRWGDDITIVARYGPINNENLDRFLLQRQAQFPRGGWSIWVNADVLVDSCVGIYALAGDDKETKYSLNEEDPSGPWTKFDPALRANLGLPVTIPNEAVYVCRALYRTDGDLVQAAAALSEFSGIATEKLEENFPKP